MSLYAKHTNLHINTICFQIPISSKCYCLLLDEILRQTWNWPHQKPQNPIPYMSDTCLQYNLYYYLLYLLLFSLDFLFYGSLWLCLFARD